MQNLSQNVKDTAFFLAAKPYISPRSQQLLDLFLFLNLSSEDAFNPVSLLCLTSLMKNLSRRATLTATEPPVVVKPQAGTSAEHIPTGDLADYDVQEAKEAGCEIIEVEPEGYDVGNLEVEVYEVQAKSNQNTSKQGVENNEPDFERI